MVEECMDTCNVVNMKDEDTKDNLFYQLAVKKSITSYWHSNTEFKTKNTINTLSNSSFQFKNECLKIDYNCLETNIPYCNNPKKSDRDRYLSKIYDPKFRTLN